MFGGYGCWVELVRVDRIGGVVVLPFGDGAGKVEGVVCSMQTAVQYGRGLSMEGGELSIADLFAVSERLSVVMLTVAKRLLLLSRLDDVDFRFGSNEVAVSTSPSCDEVSEPAYILARISWMSCTERQLVALFAP